MLIFMSNQFAETLSDAASDALPREAVLRVFALQFVQYVALLTPVGLLLGVLLAMARLNRDSEMTALAACGVGPATLLKPIGLIGVATAIGVGWLAIVEGPAAAREIELIRYQAQSEMELGALNPGQFTALDGGRTVVYAAATNGDILLDVFIEREINGRIEIVLAEEGERIANTATGDSMLLLRRGVRYEGVPGEANFVVGEFEEHGIPISLDSEAYEESVEALSTTTLLASSDPNFRAELAWRVSVPLSILVLCLLAVPLGRSSPREGKYARFGTGLLIYIIYANMLQIARVWIERGTVPDWLGLWWVHAAILALALAMLIRQSGIAARTPITGGVRLEPTG